MRKNYLTGLFVLMMASFLALVGCDSGTTSGSQNTPQGTTPVTNPDPKTLSPALRAVPTAASTASPEVLDSYTDGTNNYYLIDVGYVRNMYVSTILAAAYNGMTPISVSKTTISTSTVTEALTETISESITISDTQSGKVGIEAAWKKTFPLVGTFSAKIKAEWTGSWTNSNTSSKSKETSVSRTESLAESYTTSVTVGEHGEPAGNYRYALYATCDVYFIISTSLDNDKLLSWETAVCARDSSYTPHWDYSPDGIFDNSPDGKEITFTEDFYKNLSKPTNTEPPVNTPTTIGTDFITIRTDTVRITSGYIFDNPADVVNFDVFGFNISQLKQNGYKTISFYLQLNIREIKNGCQRLYLYSSKKSAVEYLLSEIFVEHTPGKEDTSWWVHYESQLKFENISLDKFVNNEFIIGYNADKYKGDGYGLDWENKDLKIQLVIKK
jgi:hypothetical protein